MTAKPNLNYIQAYLTEARQYPPHLVGDLSQLNANTIQVLQWAEHLELELSNCSTSHARIVAERDSIRRAHTKLAASADLAAVQELKNQLAEAQGIINSQQAEYASLLEASSVALAAEQRVRKLVADAEARATVKGKGGAKAEQRPTFLLTSAVQAELDGTASETR